MGYADASVTRITDEAKVAQGTFYNYFESREELSNKLLPVLGDNLLDYIRQQVGGISDGLKREEVGFRAFFKYLLETPEFYRILNEAEIFAPKAYKSHMTNMVNGYVQALSHSKEEGLLPGYDERELEVIAYILLSARNYLSMRYSYEEGVVHPIPEWVVNTYMKMISGGFSTGRDFPPPSGAALHETALHVFVPGGDATGDRASPGFIVTDEEKGRIVLELLNFQKFLGGKDLAMHHGLLDLLSATAARISGDSETLRGLRGPDNLSITVCGSVGDGKLVAEGVGIAAGPNAFHLTLHIRRNSIDGPLVATAQAMFRGRETGQSV
ncbi:MAG: TetR/AcrR family transcriptional regulator [Rhodobacteraceae bacterium]|nr:TetR/AcrR family transcriptional regulator [Paracoccaceae bacterium]